MGKPTEVRTAGMWLVCLIVFLGLHVLGVFAASACQAAEYAYDGSGRLVAMTRSDGQSARYVYDEAGNLKQIVSVPANALAIFSLVPDRGAPGQRVAIFGQAFDTNSMQDVVRFNGAAADVLQATSNMLVVTVPPAATSGPVSVSVASSTAMSDEDFIVAGERLAPVVNSFSPEIASVGDDIVVLGEHMQPSPGATAVSVNGQVVSSSSLTDSQLVFRVPKNLGSGPISVETPFGIGRSEHDLLITPPGLGATDIAVVERAQFGVPCAMTIPGGSKYGVLLFSVSDDQWITYQLHELQVADASIQYFVYGPRNQLIANGNLSTSKPSIHLPRMDRQGTYAIYIKSGNGDVTVEGVVDADSRLKVDDTLPVNVGGDLLDQSMRTVFFADSGSTYAMRFYQVGTNPPGGEISIKILDAQGVKLLSTVAEEDVTLNLPAMLKAGFYQVIVSPPSATSDTAEVRLLTGVTGNLEPDGPSRTYETALMGENVYLTFAATDGDDLELALTNTFISQGTYQNFNVSVYDEHGGYIGSTTCTPNSTCAVHLWNLAADSYRVTVAPPGSSQILGFTATLTRDLRQNLGMGQSQSFNLERPGQTVRFLLEGSMGQSLSLGYSGLMTQPNGRYVTLTMFAPDGTRVSEQSTSEAIGAVNFPDLPLTGTYQFVVSPRDGLLGQGTVSLAGNPVHQIEINGNTLSLTTTLPGQSSYLSFDAEEGDNLEFALSALASSPGWGVNIRVAKPGGTSLASAACSNSNPVGGNSCSLHLWKIAAGSYQIEVKPVSAAGILHADATLTEDIPLSLAIDQSISVDLQRPGQVARLSFNGVAGQTLVLGITDFATTPVGQEATWDLYAPNGSKVTYLTTNATNDALNMGELGYTGIYTVVFSPKNGAPAEATFKLTDGYVHQLSPSGLPSTFATSVPGENAYLRFHLDSPENMMLALSSVTTSTHSFVTLTIRDSAGQRVKSMTCYDNGSTCTVAMPSLNAGNYQMTVEPSHRSGDLMQFTAVLEVQAGN